MFSLSWKILHIVAFLIGNSSLRGEGIECWPWSPDLVSCVGWVCFWSLSLLQVYYNINNVVKNSFLVTPGSERVCLSSTTTSIIRKRVWFGDYFSIYPPQSSFPILPKQWAAISHFKDSILQVSSWVSFFPFYFSSKFFFSFFFKS